MPSPRPTPLARSPTPATPAHSPPEDRCEAPSGFDAPVTRERREAMFSKAVAPEREKNGRPEALVEIARISLGSDAALQANQPRANRNGLKLAIRRAEGSAGFSIALPRRIGGGRRTDVDRDNRAGQLMYLSRQ